ncbi:MAG: TonB-dependent receptor [Gemmatimonadetes bacterium]|nr:TonB-dependent receptor [Gemmatimonadota bacterium]
MPRLCFLFLVALALGAPSAAFAQEAEARVVLYGRVTDAETGRAVPDAEVRLGEALSVTDAQGLFSFEAVPAGRYLVRVEHLGFGTFEEAVDLVPPTISLRIRISATAIQLDPVVVTALGRDEQRARSSGSQRNVVTREEIAQSQGTGTDLGRVLARSVPGVQLRQAPTMGAPICIEFRGARTLDPSAGCNEPMVFLDGVRVSAPRFLYASLPLEEVERMEMIPPGEAGVGYGADSRFGVLLITTRTAASIRGEPEGRVAFRGTDRAYDWSLEGQDYGWEKVFLTAAVANAAGLALGVVAGRSCLSFDGLSNHFFESECGSLATAGARLALVGFPLLGTTLGARWSGDTDLSRGRWAHTLLGAALVGVPGYILAASGGEDAFGGASWAGGAFLLVGVPAVATLADRLFRTVR